MPIATKIFGPTRLAVPELGLGTWKYHGGTAPLLAGLDAGARFIDTAESYGSEEIVGQTLRAGRDTVFLASKVSPENFTAPRLRLALDASLQRLGVDHIDLYQLHYPNPDIPVEETLGAMEAAVDAGKIRWIGVSNFTVPDLERARKALSKHPLAANQVRYSIIDRTIEHDILPYCQQHEIAVIAYSPLARGLPNLLDCDPEQILQRVATAHNRSIAQVALNWCLQKPGVFVIPKGNSIEHVRDVCGASGWQLSPSDLNDLTHRIRFRRRSGAENLLRDLIPPGFKQLLKVAMEKMPAGIRRRFR